MIELTYEKYAVPLPELHGQPLDQRRHYFFPDQLVDAMVSLVPRFDAYQSQCQSLIEQGQPEVIRTLPFEDGEPWRFRVYIPEPKVSRDETLALARKTIERIDPAMGKRFHAAVDNGWIDENQAHAAGFGRGRAGHRTWSKHDDGRIATMFMTWDCTINDPVYLAHETGHYLALVARGDHDQAHKFTSRIAPVISEAQAFFCQHAFYDEALNLGRSPTVANAVALHRQAEMLNLVTRSSKALVNHQASKSAVLEECASGVDWYKALENHGSFHTDAHSGGNFLGAGLYKRFIEMGTADRAKILSVLYTPFERFSDNDGAPTLEALLQVCDADSADGLNELFADGADVSLRTAEMYIAA